MSGLDDGVGVGPRLGAFALDALLVFVVAGPLIAVTRSGIAGAVLLGVVAPMVAAIACWHFFGATPGKITFSARIVDARSGARPSLARLAIRFAAYLASALPFFLGFVWIAIDRRKQAWHDKIAGTRVVYDDD